MGGATQLATRMGVNEVARLLLVGQQLVSAGADEDEVLAFLVALRTILDMGTWGDADGIRRPYLAAGLATVAGGNCTQANGDLASALAVEGFEMSLLDLSREPYENHVVADARLGTVFVVIDVALSPFVQVAPWPCVAPRDGYLAETGFRVVSEERVE